VFFDKKSHNICKINKIKPMMNKRKFLLFAILILLNFNISVHACSLTNLTSCSFSDLKEFIINIFSSRNEISSCTDVDMPVCSKSNKTYKNICLLKEQKEEFNYFGTCLEYPYDLSANNCVKEKFEWDGYKCIKKSEEQVQYDNKELGLSLVLPPNSKIKNSYIELPKERNNTNLIYKKLEIKTGNYCSDVSFYIKVKEKKEIQINENTFKVIKGENNLDYGNNVSANVSYVDYILGEGDSCIGFLFSMYSAEDDSFTKYDENIETANFENIIKNLSFIDKKQERQSPCSNYGDLNGDGVISDLDLDFFIFGSIENNDQKKGDLDQNNIIDYKDQNILQNFLNNNIEFFPACSFEEEIKKGFVPKVFFDNSFDVKQDKQKSEANIRINFDITAKNGDVFIPFNGMHFRILNEDKIKIDDYTWNTGAEIKEDGFIFLENGKTTWVSMEFKLMAKEKPTYTQITIDKIDYIDKKGELKNVSTSIETNKFYLNYVSEKGNLVCGNYGDINKDGYIKADDISYIVTNKELDDEQKLRADVTGNGEVNLIDAIEIQKYILKGEPFTVCSKTFSPKIYDSVLVNVQSNSDKTKHVFLTFYLDSDNGDALIPAKISLNQDDDSSGIYIETERDGNVAVKNLKLFSSAEPTQSKFLKIKKGVPNWVKLEFDIEAINDTALINFKINKIAYLENNEINYVYPSGVKTGDIFLNYEKKQFALPCGELGDLDLNNVITYSDYNYLKNNLNILLRKPDQFIYADLNKDGILDDLDLKELDDFLNERISTFSGCSKNVCNSNIEPVYTKDDFIYANECYLNNTKKQVNCYINKDCGL